MTTSQMQAQFEVWWARKDLPESMKASYYMAWHDSRAEVVVELPDPIEVHDTGDYQADTIDVLQSAGITVKP